MNWINWMKGRNAAADVSQALTIVLFVGLAMAQTDIYGSRNIHGYWNTSGAEWTKPFKSGTSLPATCSVGEAYNKTDGTPGWTLYVCTATNTWTQVAAPISPLWLPTVGCSGTTGTLIWDTLTANAPTANCSAGTTETTLMRGVADFPDSDGAYSIQQELLLPAGWSGAIDLKLYWRSAATSGSVVWQAATICRGTGEVDDALYNAASTVTDTAMGTASQINDASITGLTATGCGGDKFMHLKIIRDRTHASDTIAGVVSLKGVRVTLRRTM